jgi:hypothetical protein
MRPLRGRFERASPKIKKTYCHNFSSVPSFRATKMGDTMGYSEEAMDARNGLIKLIPITTNILPDTAVAARHEGARSRSRLDGNLYGKRYDVDITIYNPVRRQNDYQLLAVRTSLYSAEIKSPVTRPYSVELRMIAQSLERAYCCIERQDRGPRGSFAHRCICLTSNALSLWRAEIGLHGPDISRRSPKRDL